MKLEEAPDQITNQPPATPTITTTWHLIVNDTEAERHPLGLLNRNNLPARKPAPSAGPQIIRGQMGNLVLSALRRNQ